MTDKTDVVFHVHVRKCGGTTFWSQILEREFGDSFARDSSLIEYQYTVDQVREIIGNCPWLRAYSSHKISLDLPYESTDVNVWAIVFVRDPLTRVLSHYFYLRHNSRDWDLDAKNMPLDEYIKLKVRSNAIASEAQYSQLQQLVGSRGFAGLQKVNSFLENGRVLLFPIERFDDACICLEHQFARMKGKCHYSHIANTSIYDQEVDSSVLALLNENIDPAETELWKLSQESLDKQINQFIPDNDRRSELRKEFLGRCDRSKPNSKSCWWNPISWKKKS